MKVIVLAVLIIFSISCERHKVESSIKEQRVVQYVPLTQTEELTKAYFEKDYDTLSLIFASGDYIDKPVIDGKNLLFLSVESLDYRMALFLIQKGASKDASLVISGETISILAHVENLKNENNREIILNILTGSFSDSAETLFSDYFDKILTNSSIDLEWINLLAENFIGLKELSEKSFNNILIKKASLANNYIELYSLLMNHIDIDTKALWQSHVEKPFTKGKFRKAKCEFIMRNTCNSFEEFLNSCEPKFIKKLNRAKSNILPLINFRNSLLDC
jgi:hypothetical protein